MISGSSKYVHIHSYGLLIVTLKCFLEILVIFLAALYNQFPSPTVILYIS